ncbi:putative receptor-like protein kinase At1g80870 [Macadamia integrifolia]|uniref:putative receptor-like protein kinase At1g80870 n=1 Tax=Macadamia integrifolia TaxID=60698 RepID=UPI001C4F951F|nr:putative receptor-like protein kinase At1g80870 [Macadamia integrifolia]
MPSRPFGPNPKPTPGSILRARTFFLAITISSSVLLFLGILFLLCYLWYSLFDSSRTSPFDTCAPLRLQRFSYKELKSATNVFSEGNSIGKGGSGAVFRGILRDGKSVAVKRLDATSLQAEREFQNELQVLGSLRSPYVVTLLGYCVEKKKRFLVYEYMPNKSLQESLFAEGPGVPVLDWNQRFEIIVDIARALAFLHLECDSTVIHGDIKPSNVLLSSDYRAKISDFGLSRIKSEGEFGVEIFSQEFGPSQELWKSQELSGNLAVVPPEIPTETTTEVDFALALQASSSKNSRISFNMKSLSSNPSTPNEKGKEVFATDMGGEDFDDELYSIDNSKELNFNSYVVPIDDTTMTGTKQWGKDWWWRQDGSGELCSKDYVTEWIGSQICPSTNPDWDEGGKSSPVTPTDMDNSTAQRDQLENANETQFHYKKGWYGRAKKKSEKKEDKGGKNGNKKQRKMQEWWKEEHLAEITKKGNKLSRKLEASCRRGFKIPHFDLGRRFRPRKATTFGEQIQNDYDPNVEFSFRKGWKKKKKTQSATGSDMWSGDLFSRELSSTTSMRGTVCYVAPEYGGCGYLIEKADIYSLGVLILVIVSGRRPLHVLSSPMKLEKANLISWCRQLAHTGNVLELVDERLKDNYNKDQASLCINLGLLCIQKMPELRPDAGEIVKILKGEMDLPGLPIEFSPSPPSKLLSRSRRKKKADV